MEKVLDLDKWLAVAKKAFLLSGIVEFEFPIRRQGSSEIFYAALERELREAPELQISSYRTVKEGFVKVARPSQIRISMPLLKKAYPDLEDQYRQFQFLREHLAEHRADEFLQKNYLLIVANIREIESVINIFEYLIANKECLHGLRPRELPHSESSKLMGNSGLLLALLRHWLQNESLNWEKIFEQFGLVDQKQEIRFFAPTGIFRGTRFTELHGVIYESQRTLWSFEGLHGAIVIENYETFLTVSEKVEHHLVVWGQGWKVISFAQFLNLLPLQIHYWGDLDSEGLEIFLCLRESCPAIRSLGMHSELLRKYERQIQRLESASAGGRKGSKLVGDNSSEDQLYRSLIESGFRLEQEKIPWLAEPEFDFLSQK